MRTPCWRASGARWSRKWAAWGETAATANAVASFEQVIGRCAPPPAALVAARLDSAAVAAAILLQAETALPGAYADRDPRNAEAHLAREFLRKVATRAYEALLAEPDFMARLAPDLWRGMLEGQDRIEARIDALSDELRLSQGERDALKAAVVRAETQLGSTESLILVFIETITRRKVERDQIAASLFQMASEWREAGRRIPGPQGTHPRPGALYLGADAGEPRASVHRAGRAARGGGCGDGGRASGGGAGGLSRRRGGLWHRDGGARARELRDAL